MGENAYSYDYDPIGDQKSAKPKAQPPGDRDFEAVRMHGARRGIPRRSGNCNRLQSAVAVGSGQPGETTYAANSLNQYTAVTGGSASSPTYDCDGNMLTNGLWAYTWDAENRLVSACSNNLLLVANTYDHQSRRIRKEVSAYNVSTSNFEPVTCNLFLYDGWNPIRETISNQQSAITNYYTWGADLSGTLQGAGGVGGLLAVTCVSSSTSNLSPITYYPTYDANGNITAYLDSTGAVAARFEYDAFGNTISEALSNVSTLELSNFPFRFSTKYLDAETGMYYYGYRFYSPELGRWVSRDPIGETGGTMLYSILENNTLETTDFLGLLDEKKGCPCLQSEIDDKGVRMSDMAFKLTKDPANDFDAVYDNGDMERKPVEFGGRICCRKSFPKGEVYAIAPTKGYWHREEGGGWKASLGLSEAPTCGSDDEVGIYHSHPDESGFSPDDRGNKCIYLRNSKSYFCWRYMNGKTCYWDYVTKKWRCM